MRIHEGYNAIHTGSTIYDHGYAFFRDNYWIQRAYFKAGRLNAPKKDFEFMINCVKENGLANSYKISTGEPQFSSMEVRVETPAFLPLMTQNYYLWTKDADLIFQIYPLLRNIMKEPLPAPNGLFILNSDETWIWPSYVNEIDYYIDNSYLMIAAAEFIENITYSIDFVEPSEKSNQFDRFNLMKYNLNHESLRPRSQKIQNKGFLKEIMDFKENIIKAVFKNYLDHDKMEFAHSIDINSLKDTTSFIQSASTPFLIKNIFEALDEFKTHDILDTKSICKNTFHKSINSMGLYDEQTQPLIRSHSRTAATVGNIFGHSLFAATEMNLPNNIMAKLIDSSLKSLSCTGTSAEIFDIYYPRWCTEKRRLWDSLSIFEGFLHYLFEIEPGIEVCKFRPKILNDKGYTIIKDIQIHSNNYIALAYRARDLDKMIHDNPFIGDIKEGILWAINQMAYESIADDEQFDSPLNEEITDHELPPRYRSNDYLAATNMIVKEIYQKPNLPQTDYKFLVQTTMDSQILVFSNNNIGIPHNNEPQSEIFLYFIEPEPVSKEAMEYLSQLNIFKMKEQYTNNMFLNKYYANANKDINEEHVNFEQAQPSEAFNFDFIIDNIKSLQSFTDEELSFILNRDPEFLEKKHIIMRSGASILKNDIMSYKIDPAFLQDIENIFSKDMSAGELKIVNHNTESFQSSLSYEDYRELYHDNTGKNDNLENSEEKMQPAETEEDYSIEDSDKIKDFSLLLNISKCPILYVDMKLIRCSSSTNFNGISIDIVFFENTNEYELLILNKSSFPLIFYVNNEFIVIPDLGIYTQSGNVEYAENPEEKPKEDMKKSREKQILVPKDKNCELVKKQLLEKIIFDNNIPNAIILYDSASENHAKEIYRELILLKSTEFIRQITDFEKPIDQMPFSPTTNLIIVTELKKNQLLDLERYEKILEEDNYSIWKHCVPPLRFLIIVHNHGHVYKDTIDLCNDLGTYLRPRRLRARSMFPYGFFTFLDEMGEPFGDSLTIKVFTSKPMSLYYNDKAITVDGDESKTEQGIELTDQLRKEMEMAFVMVGSFDYDITNPNLKLLNNRIIKLNVNSPLKIQNEKGLEKPYIVIKTIKPFAPFEASASGMSSGKNMMKVIIETDSEEQIDILIQILFDQQTHLAWLNGSQRERVKDPCQLVKLENGDKIFQAVLHPGRDIHPKALIHKNRPKYRTVHAVFGRYPRWN